MAEFVLVHWDSKLSELNISDSKLSTVLSFVGAIDPKTQVLRIPSLLLTSSCVRRFIYIL